jgi:hypothetical protein
MNRIYSNRIYRAEFVKKELFQTRQYSLEQGHNYRLRVQYHFKNEKKEITCSNIYSLNFTHEVNCA